MIAARMRSVMLTLLSSLFWIILAIVTSLLLVGCGGSNSRVADGGIEGTGVSQGSITGFGSIFVNGVEFETASAAITLDGNPVSESDLEKGMVVTVQGTISGDSGTAITVDAEDVVKGIVDSVAVDGLSLVVLGQTVLVDNDTVVDNNIPGQDIGNLKPGVDLVEVHGFVKGNGLIGASFIERKGALVDFRVNGFVENANPAAKTFSSGALTIDYSAADTDDLPGGAPVNGQLVEVKGQNTLGPSGELIATRVEPEGLGVADAPQAEVEGFVTSMTSISDFVVNSQRIVTTGTTVFAGALQSEIIVGLKIEVEGTLSGGVLTATKVSFRDSVKLESDVANIGASSLTLEGLPGITVTVNSQTEFKGNAAGFGDILVGEHLRIRGRVAAGNAVIASEVDERSANTDVVLQGPVDASSVPADQILSILGVTVDTTGIADVNFKGLDDMPLGRAGFFATVQPTDLVKVQGSLAGAIVSWDEIELED